MTKSFPKLMADAKRNRSKVLREKANRINTNVHTHIHAPLCAIFKLLKTKEKGKILKAATRKMKHYIQRKKDKYDTRFFISKPEDNERYL